jgi:hypothetical protein
MVIVPNGAGVLGYSTIREHPVLGNIRLNNRPRDIEEMRANSRRPDILDGLRAYISESLDLIEAHGATAVVVEMPFHAEKWAPTQTLPRRSATPEEDREFLTIVSTLVARNNSTAREIAGERGVLFVETDALVRDDLMSDDCHFNVEGERAFAALLFDAATTVIDGQSRRRTPATRTTPQLR